jgi:hypothetical protein
MAVLFATVLALRESGHFGFTQGSISSGAMPGQQWSKRFEDTGFILLKANAIFCNCNMFLELIQTFEIYF